ncbi:MAG TPA: hypothetical protein VLJ80_03745 [Solirubrobacteraceae bacterium]|nr:hypothetical protein [Solirubrobacteraceae bacterium]
MALAACGSSGSGSSSAGKTSGSSTNKAGAPNASRFTALSSCLKKEGITLPSAPSGATPQPGGPGAGAPGGGGFQLPKGVSQAQFQAALKKCGAGNLPRGRGGGLNSASARAGLAKYAACLRQNGINVPTPNTTGKGPVFDTKGIDTSSSKFKAAQGKCQSDLKGVFPGGGGGAPPTGAPNGAPPAGAGEPPTGEGSAR